MSGSTVHILATYTGYLLIFLIPILAFIFTDRFRRHPTPQQYAGLFGALFLIGFLLFLPAISVVAATGLCGLLLAWGSSDLALRGVTYTRVLSPPRLFPGDTADLTVELQNRKLLPLAWISLFDPISIKAVRATTNLGEMLDISGGVVPQEDMLPALPIRTAMAPYQSVERTYRLTGLQRGVYKFGPASVASGDPFGMFTRSDLIGGGLEVVVYPRLYSPDELGLPFREAMGNLVARRALYQDPTLLAGSREYRPGDPLNHMHWKATARTGGLQVRLHDPSTTALLMVVLNIETFAHVREGVDVSRMEAVIEAGASIAMWGLNHDFAVGLLTNGMLPGVGHTHTGRIPPSAHPRQGPAILEHLARIGFSGRASAEEIVLNEIHRLPPGGSMMLVTSIVSPALAAALRSPGVSGRVSVVYCGRTAPPIIPNVPVAFMQPPSEDVRAAS